MQNDLSFSESTFYEYINALQRLYIIENVPAWNPAIRSKTAIRCSAKLELSDPSLVVAALGMSPERLLQDLPFMGFVFETLCIRDLRVYSQSLGGSISYYHDRYGLECDCVLHLRDGRYALVECKLGGSAIDEGADHLLELKRLIEQHHMQVPSFLMVLTGSDLAYERPDGVKVVPIGCLGCSVFSWKESGNHRYQKRNPASTNASFPNSLRYHCPPLSMRCQIWWERGCSNAKRASDMVIGNSKQHT